jgi:hypothetical protein
MTRTKKTLCKWKGRSRNKRKKLCAIKEDVPLAACQATALQYVQNKAAALSEQAIDEFFTSGSPGALKLESLGISLEQMMHTLDYIRERAPVIICFNPALTLPLLLQDTHYRNQFETSTSGGYLSPSARARWESAMFQFAYDNAQPAQRCKYGCLHVHADCDGVDGTRNYGDAFFVLKKHVRTRITLCYGDSGNSGGRIHLGTLANFAHILQTFPDSELKTLVNVACEPTFVRKDVRKPKQTPYTEAQIHGDILLRCDIDMLVLQAADASMLVLAEQFRAKFGVDYVVAK